MVKGNIIEAKEFERIKEMTITAVSLAKEIINYVRA